MLDLLTASANLTEGALTVSAQAVSPNDNGQLLYDVFFPRQDVNSIKLDEIVIGNHRPVSSRREWNGPGRLITQKTPERRSIEMIPVEDYFAVDEREMQLLSAGADGEEGVMMRRLGFDIPSRVDGLAEANFRRLEVDAFRVWQRGEIVQDDPQTGRTFATSFLIDPARIQTAATTWATAANAYQEFMAWVRAGRTAIGSAAGVMLRETELDVILADAPTLLNGYRPTTREVTQRVQDELGTAFRFVINEATVDVYVDGGTTTTPTKVFEAGRLALIPNGTAVGATAFAPVRRARQIAQAVPEARVDVRGQAVYYSPSNDGKHLNVNCQVNAMPIPIESRIWVIDVD